MKYIVSGILLIVIVILLLSLFVVPSTYDTKLKICREVKDMEIQGVVLDAYNDLSNHYVFTIILHSNNKRIKIFGYCMLQPELYIKKGDSLSKESGSFDFNIYKKGVRENKVVVNCGEDFDCTCEKLNARLGRGRELFDCDNEWKNKFSWILP